MKPSEYEIDVLREIANIGSGNAATSLSSMLNLTIHMETPNVRIVPFHKLADPVGGVEASVVAVYFQLEGDVEGSMFLLMGEETARILLDTLLQRPEKSQKFSNDEMYWSTLSEVGNIVVGSYLSALSDMTGLMLRTSIPHITYDMAGAVLDVGVYEIGQVSDEALVIDTQLSSGNVFANTHFILLPHPDHLPVLFHALGVKTNGN